MTCCKTLACTVFAMLPFMPVLEAQQKMAEETYARAVSFLNRNLIDEKVFNLHIEPHWFDDNSGIWFVDSSPEGETYTQIRLPGLERSPLFDHERLAQELTEILGEKVDPGDLPIRIMDRLDNGQFFISVKGKVYRLDTNPFSFTLEEDEGDEQEGEILSPDEKWAAFSRDHNLYIRSTENGELRQLSKDGQKDYEYASWYGWGDIMEGEGGERPEHFGLRWSPDMAWIQANVCDLRSASKMYLLNWSVDTLYRPKLLSYYRGSPGDTGMVYIEPVFYNVETGQERRPDLPRSTHINSIGVDWSDTPGLVYLEQSSRGFKEIKLYRYNLNTDNLEQIYSENSPTNIDNFTYELAEDSGKIFFLSEKSGWRQLYSLDLVTGAVRDISRGDYFINDIEHINEDEGEIQFTASGVEGAANPYQQYLYRIAFDGSGLVKLTPEDLNHSVGLSPDGKYFVDNMSSVSVPTRTILREANSGDVLLELGKADISGLDHWQTPQTFTVLAGDGHTKLYGALWKPTNFDPSKRYPVIDNSYTGPHTYLFPTQFRQAFYNQSLAELGFIVIRVDGRGSANRSKAFHNYSYKNLGGGLADHIVAMRQLGEELAWLDTTRVGIFGHSAGGYDAAHGVLAYPDFYDVAVSSSADHDHRMEKAWWPEMYMGWPVDSAYHQQSNITLAGNLKGKLLITHGGIDENVNPSATFKLAEALVQADKPFDMKIFPSQRHGYQGAVSLYFTKLRWNYFIEHMLEKEPLWDIDWE